MTAKSRWIVFVGGHLARHSMSGPPFCVGRRGECGGHSQCVLFLTNKGLEENTKASDVEVAIPYNVKFGFFCERLTAQLN